MIDNRLQTSLKFYHFTDEDYQDEWIYRVHCSNEHETDTPWSKRDISIEEYQKLVQDARDLANEVKRIKLKHDL